MENCTFAEFNRIAFYSTYIRPCCELAHAKFVKCSSKTYKSGDICKIWCRKPVREINKYCDIIKICTFRPLLFVPGTDDTKKYDPSDCQFGELNLEKLNQIETLEEVTDITKKFAKDQYFINGLLEIGTQIDARAFCVDEALDWMKYADDIGILYKLEKLGDFCWPFLEIFFAEYKHHIIKVVLEDYDLVEAFESQYCENCIKKSESMKMRGNEAFAEEKFDTAVTSYTKAIELWPENHLLYGNRALCFLRTEQYIKALWDGKRSIVLKPNWPKGHYRFCDALSLMGKLKEALQANERGQELCRDNPEGIKDLIQQHEKLKMQIEEIRVVKQSKHRMKKPVFQKISSASASVHTQESKKSNNEKKKQSDSHHHLCQQKQTKVAANALTKDNKDQLSDFASVLNEYARKPRIKMGDSERTRDPLNSRIDSQKDLDKQNIPCGTIQQADVLPSLEMLKTCIKNACSSLMDQRFHSAEQSFALLLNTLDPSQLQQLNLAVVDYVVIIYGYATALLGIGQVEELTKAKDHFNSIIEQYQKVRFDCLAHYGIGKVYLRQNRFLEALDQFLKSKTMVSHRIVPGILTWPTTSVVIEETRTENLQVILERCIEECKFPPNPDAVCRYQQCQAHKIKIYFSDPHFKGFIRVACCEQCIVEFHVNCWKKLKATRYSDKNDKDILQELCFTPDCRGLISKIVVFSSCGIVKCEFEHKVKNKNPPKPIVKQKCSSSRNLQAKQERKLRRRFMKEAATLTDLSEIFHRENCVAKDDCHKGNVQKRYFGGDTVLQVIVQHAAIIQGGVHDVFKLLNELISWWVLSEEDYARFSSSCTLSTEVMEQIINFLIAKNDRVKTRIFVHILSELEEVEPKLHDWMKHLDNNGLKATKLFVAEHVTCFLELDLSLIAVLWNEKYGIKQGRMFTCTSEDMFEILDYFAELSFEEIRCFLWMLEENRENFPFLHQFLDDYFDNMDNPFTIITREENEDIPNNAIKVKNRNRKKAKGSKAILVVSGGVSTVTREEDNIFSEENTLSFMNPHEPFRIPDGLHEQVEIFEALYNNVPSSNNYQRILDNYPDPTCESLYDYFSQILEEHGPMEIDNQLLVGEYEHFPEDTRKIVEDAGGLESFLLESLRFVMMGDLIGLMKHAVMLKENAEVIEEEIYSSCLHSQENNSQNKPRLNPAAKEFKPTSYINKPYVPISSNTAVASDTPEYMTTSRSSFSPFVSKCSFSGQTTDTVTIPLPSTIPDNQPVFLNEISSAYQNERTFPGLTQIPLMPDISEKSKHIYADCNAYLDIDPGVISDCKYNFGNLAASDEVQMFQNSPCVSVKSSVHPGENKPDWVENHSIEAECSSVTKIEIENKSVARNNPRSRMIAVQVDQELTDEGVNTLPLQPYETQQGDLLRMEKEHQVLQEQLKEASEKSEQLQTRSSIDMSVLEEELLLLIEGNKLTKRELDWFHQDVDMEMKRWQQEKKENQEGLKVGKNKVRKLTETNEIYMKNIDEKNKHYKRFLDDFLEISNKSENEKVKMEELIKKSHNDHQECVKRAIAAEVSVLENWKETELFKLHRRATNAEANLKYLKFMTSRSTVPQSKLQIDSWESFISNIKEEIGKAEREFEERICMVKNGAFLSSISPVEIAEIQPPTDLSVTHERPPINDPAIVMCSAAAPHLPSSLFAPFSSVNDNSPLHSTFNMHSGNKMSSKGPRPSSANKDLGEAPPEFRGNVLSDQVCLPRPPRNSKTPIQDIQLQHSTLEEPAAAAWLDHVKAIRKLPLPKASIIDQLRTIFPHHTRADLENFIKEVKVKNKNKLSTDELLSRVTEFILDHPNKKKVLPSSGKIEKPSPSASAQSGSQTLKTLKLSGQTVLKLSKSRLANENTIKTTLPSQSIQAPWKAVGGTSKSNWKKSSDATDNDTCVICYEELSSAVLHVLDCGHRFHKMCIGTWIKEHSTCPTCRHHVLLPEDYPELPGRNRTT
ncbi:E3 ubiquitin-protein ligase TTC3 isoform X1 [Elgaria multicarinata webbii]|uniref:E3 ubiquitin-protein ligase TTC3 isoform X1 n=1 Tax=Elgaria multicarinata webbii TaxID=159646 RepID=UPI002FCD1879